MESPEIEVMCGGVNTRTPRHAAVWRQGNLLHHGFEECPAELNAAGRALLENAIVCIARFREDRPILVTPSGLVDRSSSRARDYLFFTETAGYVWRIDPLAKARGVPTPELRGSQRAST